MNKKSVALLLRTLQLGKHTLSEQSVLDWHSADLNGLIPLLVFEGAELWLYRCIRQSQIAVPETLRTELRASVHRTSVINMRIDAQTVAVTTLLTNHGIAWSLLKGQARRAAATLYPYADARAVSDVDLLVPEADADKAWNTLCANGFRRVYENPVDWKADHHRPTLIDAYEVAVELHTTTAMSVQPTEAWRRATENSDRVEWSDMTVSVPNATELVWQALAHGVADGARGYKLKALLSVAAILAMLPSIDWEIIAERINGNEVLNNDTMKPVPPERTRRFLDVAGELSGTQIPAPLLPTTRAKIAPLIMWRARTLSSSNGRAAKDRLLEESTRAELRMPLTPYVPRAGVLRNTRRRSTSIVARLAYLVWRATS
ncbi:MAG: nucleotidyltransferase family protein [Gemmatimonadaceae bacterium]